MLDQQDRYGDTAIVYDPAQEYVKRFYRPERGDVILNPLDERSPYWPVGEEIDGTSGSPTAQAEARTVAESAFPGPAQRAALLHDHAAQNLCADVALTG